MITNKHRGLLAVDVDGPLNPWRAKSWRRPDGFVSYRHTRDGRWYTGKDFRRHKGTCVWLNPEHGRWLTELAEQCSLTLVWATTWLQEANTHVGPSIGLPQMPVIPFPANDLHEDGWLRTGRWKWPGVATYAAGQPIAWLDDDFGEPLFASARAEFERARGDTPTLLCDIPAARGLQPEHLEQVRTWAQTLPPMPTAGGDNGDS